MSEWISIEDEFPKIKQHVLTFESGNIPMPIKVNYIHNYENEFAYGQTRNISHWMHLPYEPE